MYYSGEGVAKNDAESIKWYLKAAEQGHLTSQNQLGFKYAQGTGVVQDYVEAYKWLNLAAAYGDEKFKKDREMLVILMTREQIAEGQKLSREWMAKRQE